jgi:DNA (cytosine-5)-methyltransferase 1
MQEEKVNVGSLFAGIGGFELGLERAGFKIEWQVEIDHYCRAVLERHFPKARRFEDVRAVGAANLDPVDVICGGFPCQDLSNAGKGAGIDGARSGLWSEFARIVRELRPRYVLVENVPALLTGKGKRWDRAPIGRVLGDLAQMGYDAEWARLSAREFGAPHLRQRVWIVAYPREGADATGDRRRTRRSRRPARIRPDRQGLSPSGMAYPPRRAEAPATPPGGCRGARASGAVADPECQRRPGRAHQRRRCGEERAPVLGGKGAKKPSVGDSPSGTGGGHTGVGEGWAVEPRVGRVAHGVPDRVDRLAALGNALVPQIPEWIGLRILEWERAARAMTSHAEEPGR